MQHTHGSAVEVRGQRWTLIRAVSFDDCAVVTLEGREASNATQRLRVIEPFESITPLTPSRPVRRSRHATMRVAARAIALARPAARLWTAATARMDMWPYQLEPALSVLAGATRVLLADTVGLGKTIQAGLILAELRERGWIERALIVCPAGLRDGWARELRRFSIEAAVFDQVSIADRIAALPPGVNPWLVEPIVIASIDFLKRSEVKAALAAVPIDLLIVDEAHHLTPGTDRGAAVAALARRSPWCVLASATPHSGDADAFKHLRDIGSSGDRLAVFRRTRRDVGLASRRRAHVVDIASTIAERRLLDAIDAYARAVWRARGMHDRPAQLIAITLQRRAASSRAAIERTLARRFELLSASSMPSPQSMLPWDDDASDDIEDDALLKVPGLIRLDDECAAIERLIALARACDGDSKLTHVARLLARVHEPVIVFTEYRDTLEAAVAVVSASHRAGAIHGGVPADVRRAIVDAFNRGDLDVLVATDTAGEGLNLHARCRLVINLEIPWNPARLEQRIGRVDRLGQRRVVHAIHLCHRDSIEAQVLARLEIRRRIASDAMVPLSERDVADAIFTGRVLLASNTVVALRSDAIAVAIEEASRVSQARQALGSDATNTPAFARPRRRGSRAQVAVHRVTDVNAAGLAIGDRILAHRIEWAAAPSCDADWRRALRQSSALLTIPLPDISYPIQILAARITAMRGALRASRDVSYQRSLFDSRADAAAAARRDDAAALDAALDRLLRRVAAPVEPTAARVDLIAAWPERRE